MFYRKPRLEEQELFDRLATHPLQSWAWGDFREKTGVEVERLIGFEGEKPVSQLQVTFHPIPHTSWNVGYLPKGQPPHESQLAALKKLGEQYNAVLIKLEPAVSKPPQTEEKLEAVRQFLLEHECEKGRALFTPYTFVVDLTKDDDALMSQMKSKTRYNVRLARRKGVTVTEDTSDEGFEEYLELLRLTTKRQEFYAHTEKYQRNMWETMHAAGMARLLKAEFEGQVLAAWVLFVFNNVLYYPYGASSREHSDKMPSNLLMWEAMQLGKRLNCSQFDMWGSLGPKPDKDDPWYGFHRFKKGYGGQLTEFVGTYDLVLDPTKYRLYRVADRWRWRYLRLKKKLEFLPLP